MASFVSIAKDFLLLVKGELDQHTTEKSNIKVNNFLSVSIFTPAHVQFAAYGRGPGKNPPIDPLIAWVRKKGIVTGIHYEASHLNPVYNGDIKFACPLSEAVAATTLSIPFNEKLTDKEIKHIIECVK